MSDFEPCVLGQCRFNCGQRCMAKSINQAPPQSDASSTIKVLAAAALILTILFFGTQMFGDYFNPGTPTSPVLVIPTAPLTLVTATPVTVTETPLVAAQVTEAAPVTEVPVATNTPQSPWVDVGPITLEQYEQCIASNCEVHWKCSGYCK